MAHIAQERYSTLVDEKLRYTLVTKDNLIFNPRYEGNPKAGKVKVPVRDTEVEVKKYDKQTGAAISAGSTTYFDINIDIDEAVNEMIDGYDAASVPDGITAERLDSAGYSLGLSMDTKSGGDRRHHRGSVQDCLHRQHGIQAGTGGKACAVPYGCPQ